MTTSTTNEHEDTILSEVLSASLGGAISATALYPLEVLKTRMQADNKKSDDASKEEDDDEDDVEDKPNKKRKELGMIEYSKRLYREEGLQVYVNGFEASAVQSAMEKAFYFFAYTGLKNLRTIILQHIQPSAVNLPMSTTINLVVGYLAEWAHLPITLPVDYFTTAIQTTTNKKQSAFALLMTILKEGNMYKGIETYFVLCFKPAFHYTFFEQVKDIMVKHRKEKTLTAAEAFVLGMIARTLATIAVYPFVRAKVIMQSQKNESSSSGDGSKPMGVMELLGDLYQKEGVSALFQGIGPEIARAAISSALMMMIKEKISGGVKNALYGKPQPRTMMSSSQS